MKRFVLISILLLFGGVQALAQNGRGKVIFADAVYHNGKVVTVDERFSVAEAVAIYQGKIMAVGRKSEILDLAGPQTPRGNLQSANLFPRFIHTPSPLFGYAPAPWATALGITRTPPHA